MDFDRRLPSLHVTLPQLHKNVGFPSPNASPSCISHAFPSDLSPVHHRLPPIQAFVRLPLPPSKYQMYRPTTPCDFRRDEFPPTPTSRFHFPVLPSLKDTLRMNPDTVESPTKTVVGVKLCGVAGCEKRAKAGGVCIAHGGGIRCSKEGCTKHAVSLGFCISHGGGKRCTAEGCQNASRKYGVCWSHGGKRMCLVQGCTKGPKTGGYCWAHGGKMPRK